jgi:predicted ATPase/DNA-binding winged helix-turn-helix (wHTH) protein
MAESATEYRFDRYTLLPGRRCLLEGERAVKLGGRAFDLLLTLVERYDRAVPKPELMERVWPRLVVEENNLQVQIAVLRKLLGPAAIATIPGRGYRFTLPVRTTGAPEPAVATSARPAAQVRAQRAPIYGRDDDVATICALLERHALVSIVGAGGIGKTRVAHAVAERMRASFAAGVRFVELAPISDPALVVPEIARAFGIDVAPGRRDDVEVVAAAVSGQQSLLVVDNCEHVLDAVATFADAVSSTSSAARVLITSQEPLKTDPECVHRLNPLSVPADGTCDDWQQHGAVQLFINRAHAADSRCVPDSPDAQAIVEICKRLDGIPLALELAAARVPLLGIEGLRARLDERFNVLTGGSRFVLRRHQTLRAALDFSHGLLSDDERKVFRRLAVFAGSCAVEAAQRICAAGVGEWHALDCLGGLVDKSMVVAEGGAAPRLRLLETTRAYALEKLADAGETNELLALHARSVAEQFRGTYDDYGTLPERDWLARYVPELDNLRAAIDWTLRHDGALAIQLVGDSLKLWQDLALQPEAMRYCAAALARVDAATSASAAGRLWYAEAMMLANSDHRRSREAARRAVALLRGAGDANVLMFALARLASAGRRDRADEEQWAALAEFEELLPQASATMRVYLPIAAAMVNRSAGRIAEARREYERACDLAAELGEREMELTQRSNVGDVALIAGNFDEAIAIYRDIVGELARRNQLFHTLALGGLATALLMKDDIAAARDTLAMAVPLLVRYDVAHRYTDACALLAARLERDVEAGRLLGYSEAAMAARDEGRDPGQAVARERALALLAHVAGEALARWMREGAQARDADLLAWILATPGAASE